MSEMPEYRWKDFDDWLLGVKSSSTIEIWTDGGCSPNPGPGGFGAILACNGVRTILTGGSEQTTNNRMELSAAYNAIKVLPDDCKIILCSDSQYVCNGIAFWMKGWNRQGWKKKDGSDISNVDIWQAVWKVTRPHKIITYWVKGHRGHPENELCDQLATSARRRISKIVKRKRKRKNKTKFNEDVSPTRIPSSVHSTTKTPNAFAREFPQASKKKKRRVA